MKEHIQCLLRENDQAIMDAVVGVSASKSELRHFNTVRMWMGVHSLAEISTADGTAITRAAWLGEGRQHTIALWPYQPKPGKKSFAIWRRLLSRAFLAYPPEKTSAFTKNLTIHQKLHRWFPHATWMFNKWRFHYSFSMKQLLYSDPADENIKCFPQRIISTRLNSNNRALFFEKEPIGHTASPPPDATPVEPYDSGRYTRIRYPWEIVYSHSPSCSTFEEYILSLPVWERLLLSCCSFVNQSLLCQMIQEKQLIYLCSDGGATSTVGSFGAVIASDDSVVLTLKGRAHGFKPGSFRAETYGMLAILRGLYRFAKFHNLQLCSRLIVYCDNQSLIKRITLWRQSYTFNARQFLYSEMDVQMQIMDTIELFNNDHVELSHVKGHQDAVRDLEDLQWKEKLNIFSDQLATEAMNDLKEDLDIPPLPAANLYVIVDGRTLTHHIPSLIRFLWSSKIYKAYLQKKHGLSSQEIRVIDWDLFRASFQSFEIKKRWFFTKWVNYILPLSQQQHQKGLSGTCLCPSRCECIETQSHFLRCPHSQRKQLFSDMISALRKVFIQNNIDPDIHKAFYYLLSLPDSTSVQAVSTSTEIIYKQLSIGQDSLFYGFFHTSLVEIQTTYLQKMKLPSKKNQAFRGLKLIMKCILDHIHSLWLLRNSHMHGKSSFSDSFNHSILLAEVKRLYDQSSRMLEKDRAIFHVPFQTCADFHSTAQLKYFLSFAKPIIQTSIREASNIKSKKETLYAYFPLVDKHSSECSQLNSDTEPK